ncbi:ATP-binding protein [Adlercreutzia shanghongiae]|uniref:AAA family ATPase n=1 Tax=Adlercreutzia shanghongiae TaxID=3111773 RepID=A0ABU6IVR7_9ACTN|nr:AAA family ATPase [Adlercreutzia sp. R22]MEC4293927.1 AAA family ATPase [Adlercreutzia sp. R22]
MLKRKAEKLLREWKNTKGTEALLVMGARQVGKTFLIDKFVREHYRNVVKFDLIDQTEVLNAFDAARSSQDLFLAISAYADAPLEKGRTAIFIDEVQECKEALTLVKYLTQRTDYDYILSVSLLGVELKGLRSAPVGYLHIVEMHPLDFQEFCWANGVGEEAWAEIADAFTQRRPVNQAVHDRFLKLFHRYLLAGGMPRPVSGFIEDYDVQALVRRQNDIIQLYRYDIAKYASGNKKLAIREIFDEMPSQLDSQTKRFNFSAIAPRGTYERYKDDFIWLVDAGVAIPVRNVSEPKRPLRLVENRSFFKLFMNDVGLLSAACGMEVVRDLVSNDFSVNYGAIYENAVAQELHAHGHGGFFFRNRKLGEIDFLVQDRTSVLPIEVKSGKTYKRHSALTQLLATANYGIEQAVVLCESNVEVNGAVTYFPVYMAAFL